MKRIILCLVLCASGCGVSPGVNPDPVPLSGSLNHDGNPLTDVMLNFQPAGHGVHPRAVVVKDGQFEVDLNPGKYTYFLSEASESSPEAKLTLKSLPEEYLQPSEERIVDVKPNMTLDLEIN